MQPRTDWKETVAPDEDARHERNAERLVAGHKGGGRTLHLKSHIGARAELTVLPDLPEPYRVGIFAAPGVYPAWVRFSNGGGEWHKLFVEEDVTAAATVPGGEPVVLRYARATVVLEGEITDGPAAGVRAVRSDGAIAWSNSVAPDGRFRLGLTPGTWLLFARNFSPNVVDGPSIAVIVSADGSYPAITITAPPR